MVKPGRKTSEFVIVASVLLAQLGAALTSVLPAKYVVYASAAESIGYALSRGLAKSGVGGHGPPA